MSSDRFEDLAPVDSEGWLADQGRNFLQTTDQRISRLRLPNFLAESTRKIQGLGSDLGQMYSGLEQGLSSLPSQAQQASTNFLTSTTGRIAGLGSQLGQSAAGVGQGFSDLGSGIRGSADDLTELLERQREDAERRREEQRERQRVQEEDARRRRDQLVQGVGDRASRLGTGLSGVRDRAVGLNEGLQTRLTGLREADAEDLGAGLERLRGLGREQEATQRRSDVGFSEAMNRAAARGGYEDVITPEETKWFREAGENLAGAGPTGNTPNVVDDAVAFLLRQGFRGGRAVVERFVRTVGEPTVRRAMQQGEALGTLFDDYLARAAEAVPGGREGPVGRLLLEEEGSAGRRRRRSGLAATPGPDRGPVNAAGEPIPEVLARNPDALSSAAPLPPSGTARAGETPLPGERPSAGVPRSRTGVPEGPREGTARDDFRRKVQMFSGEAQLPQAARDPTAGRESVLATVRNPTRRLLSGVREQLFDEYARVGDVQRRVYGDRPLSDAQDVVGRIRKFGGRAPTVEAYRRQSLDPVLEQVGQDGDILDAYVSSYDDYDKARSAGRTAVQGVLERDLGRLPGETALRRQSRVVSAGQRAVDEAELALRRAEKTGQADQIAQADTRLRQAERLLADQQRRTEDLLSGPEVTDVGLRSSAKAVQRRSEGVREAGEALDRAKLQGDEDAVASAEEGLRKARVRERNARRKLDRLQGVVDTAATQRTRGQLQQALLRGEEVQTNRVFSGDTRAHAPVQIESALSDEVGGDLGRIQRVHEGADALFEAARHARDRLHEAEIIDDQTHRYLEEHFPHYVPTVFVDKLEQGAENVLTTGAARFSVKDLREASGVPLGRRLSEQGSEGARESPITSISRLLYASETLAQRNEVARAFERMIEYDAKHGGGELAQAFVRMPDPDAQLPTTHTKFSVRGKDAQGKAEVRTYAVRKDVGSMLALDPDAFRQVAGAIGEVTGAPLARAVQTGFSPIFMLKNAVIDAQQAMQRQGGFNLGRPKEAGDAWNALFRAGRDLGALNPVAAVRGREVLDTPDYAEFIRAGGGQTSGRFGRSPGEERARALGISGFDNRKKEYLRRRMLANGQPDPGDKLLGVLDHATALKWFDTLRAAIDSVEEAPGVGGVVGGVRRFGEAIEATPRLAAYRQAKKAGKRPLEQMRAGSEVTIDFRRGGKAVRSLNAVLPFLNAAVQGSERFITQDFAKGNRANTAWALGAIGLPTLALEAFNRLGPFAEDYADVPQYLKDTGIVVMDPFADPEPTTDSNGEPVPGNRGYYYLPLNRPMAQMKAAVNESIDMATGGRPADLKALAWDVLGAAAPVDLGAGGFLPPAPRLGVELLTNKDLFRDREIVPEYVQHRPPGEQATDRTGATARLVGETIGKPPAAVEHLGAGVTGGPGRLLGPLADRAVELARPDLAPPDQRDRRGLGGVPVLGDLSEAFYRSSGGQQERDLRRRLEHEAAQQKAAVRREYVTSPGWSELPAGERQALLDDLYKEIDAEYLERLRAEREVLVARRLERQGA